MTKGYSPDETAEIARSYEIVRDDLTRLHHRLGSEFDRMLTIMSEEVNERTFARVLIIGELRRGILRDERRPVSSAELVITPRLRHALSVAHQIGQGIAPLALAEYPTLVNRILTRKLPRFSHSAKKAIIRCEMAHAASANARRTLRLTGPSATSGMAPAVRTA